MTPSKRLFRVSAVDAIPALCVVGIVAFIFWTFLNYQSLSPAALVGTFLVVALSYCWNLQCLSHNFIHNPFFRWQWLNRVFSVLETLAIGLPHICYHHYHLNHHAGDNDLKGPDGTTRDWSSIYRHSKDDQAEPFWSYVLLGYWRVELGPLFRVISRHGREEVSQAVVEDLVLAGFWAMLAWCDWRYFLCFYLPSYYLGWMASYAQGYLEHYGAMPGNPLANSVSSYNRLYNLLWFNNGYHQEHHWDPKCHWTRMPELHHQMKDDLERNGTAVIKGPHLTALLEYWLLGPAEDEGREPIRFHPEPVLAAVPSPGERQRGIVSLGETRRDHEQSRLRPLRETCVLLLAGLLAGFGAIDHAGCWNDGSRLATVECLVDHQTWAIDRSIFVAVPEPAAGRPTPYPRDNLLLMERGTLDKLWINGHFYSDKSPVPALLLAGEYALLEGLTGWTAPDRPDRFCTALTLGSSGLAYVLAVWCLWRLGKPLGLDLRPRLLLVAALGLCTVAGAYARQVNNHILLLASSLAILVEMAWLARGAQHATVVRLLGVGLLAGLSYSIDLGAGPIICGLTGVGVLWRCRRPALLVCFAVGALPWLLLHHGLNYAIGGSWKPANALPECFCWPGCPFTPKSLTGGWQHSSPWTCAVYCLSLLFGKKGFLLHNLPLLLAVAGSGLVLLRRHRDRPECLLAVGWGVGIWLVYGICSTNSSGVCCGVRWFVPLLAPGFYVLAVLLRDHPSLTDDFLILSAGGLVLGALMAWLGPWREPSLAIYWAVAAATLTAWGLFAWRRTRKMRTWSREDALVAARPGLIPPTSKFRTQARAPATGPPMSRRWRSGLVG